MNVRKGTYVLVIALGSDRDIRVGALGTFHFPKGTYCYTGSAMAGLDQRLSRHLRRDKTLSGMWTILSKKRTTSAPWNPIPTPSPNAPLLKWPRNAV